MQTPHLGAALAFSEVPKRRGSTATNGWRSIPQSSGSISRCRTSVSPPRVTRESWTPTGWPRRAPVARGPPGWLLGLRRGRRAVHRLSAARRGRPRDEALGALRGVRRGRLDGTARRVLPSWLSWRLVRFISPGNQIAREW